MAITGSFNASYDKVYPNCYIDMQEGNLSKTRLYRMRNFLGQAVIIMDFYEDQTAYLSGKKTIDDPRTITIDFKKEDLIDKIKWDGTTTVVAETSAEELQVGDWIALNSNFNFFEISAIDGLSITISNPESLTIPDTSATYEQSCKSSGIYVDYWRYFAQHILAKAGIEPIYQCEEYVINELEEFSSFTRV